MVLAPLKIAGHAVEWWQIFLLAGAGWILAGGSYTMLGSESYLGAWEAGNQLAGVSFDLMMERSTPEIWVAGESRSTVYWMQPGQVMHNSNKHMGFDPDGDAVFITDGYEISGKYTRAPNVDIVVGDFYESENSGLRLLGRSVVNEDEPITITQGDYNVTSQVKYMLEKWRFDVMVRFWSNRDEMRLVKDRLWGSSVWAMEGESFHEATLTAGDPGTSINDDAYDGNPSDVKVYGLVWVVPWDSRADPESGVMSEDIWAAIANMRIVDVRRYLSNHQLNQDDTVDSILSSRTFQNDYDNNGFFDQQGYIKYDNGELQTQGKYEPVSMYASLEPYLSAMSPENDFSRSAIEKYNTHPDSRNRVYYELYASGLPAWASRHATIDGGEEQYVDWFSVSAVYTVEVEVLRSAEFEIEKTRLGGELVPPWDWLKEHQDADLFDWFNTLGDYRWILLIALLLVGAWFFMPIIVAGLPVFGNLMGSLLGGLGDKKK